MSTIDDIRSLTQLAMHGMDNAFDTIVAIDELCEVEQRKPKASQALGRDEQFRGFAMAVVEKVTGNDEYDETDWVDAIAHAAYDLVSHTLVLVPHLLQVVPDAQHLHEVMPHIPDLPELPEQE